MWCTNKIFLGGFITGEGNKCVSTCSLKHLFFEYWCNRCICRQNKVFLFFYFWQRPYSRNPSGKSNCIFSQVFNPLPNIIRDWIHHCFEDMFQWINISCTIFRTFWKHICHIGNTSYYVSHPNSMASLILWEWGSSTCVIKVI